MPVTDDNPEVSIIIPVWREEAIIEGTLAHVSELTAGRRCQVLVVDGHPDATTLRTIEGGDVVGITSARGRGTQMNAGAAAATGRVLLFLHADTALPEGAIDDVMDACARPGVVGGAFSLRFDSARAVYGFMSWCVTRWTSWTGRPFGDQAIFIERNYLGALGGFADIPIMEDVELTKRVRRRGDRLRVLPAAVVTSSRRFETEGLLRRVLGNALMQFLFRLGVSPFRLARLYSGGRDDSGAETS